MNHFKTYMLLAGLTALFMAAGFLIGGATGMMIALVFALAMNAFSYWNADKIVLRTYGAVEVDESHPEPLIRNYVIDTVEMARSAGLPRPRITVIDSAQPNAFATGRDPDHAAVAASTGLLQLLTREEIRGVMAHELAHVKNRDTLVMTVTATIAGAISALANFAFFFGGSRDEEGNGGGLGGMIGAILIAILAPIAAMLVQMAISRAREYEADRIGAQIAGDSESLARALQKIEAYARGGYENVQAERNPATAHMFIINPLAGKGADNLFSTHPATHNRVEALMRLGVERGARRPAMAAATSSSVPLSGERGGPWS